MDPGSPCRPLRPRSCAAGGRGGGGAGRGRGRQALLCMDWLCEVQRAGGPPRKVLPAGRRSGQSNICFVIRGTSEGPAASGHHLLRHHPTPAPRPGPNCPPQPPTHTLSHTANQAASQPTKATTLPHQQTDLVVDAPRLVALGADDVEAAQRHHLLLLSLSHALVLALDPQEGRADLQRGVWMEAWGVRCCAASSRHSERQGARGIADLHCHMSTSCQQQQQQR